MQCFQAATCILLAALLVKEVASECRMTDAECEYYLTITEELTMAKDQAVFFPEHGKLYRYDVKNTSTAAPADEMGIIQADGYEKQLLVIVANGTMPGPTIEAYEGQTLIVHVTNRLINQDVSIHWHGIHQTGTPFMDGVAFITQCPILQGQTFTYRFKAAPKGTFWYHSHLGDQRTMGLFGPLIIREKKPMEMEEHILSLQDWAHDDSTSVFLKMKQGAFENREKLKSTQSYDGSKYHWLVLASALINGKGRIFYPSGTNNGAPLTVFKMERGKQYRFRVIAAGNMYPFRLSIDQHELTIVASDGYDLQPKIAESLIINPGERIDFIITANNSIGNFWIRAKTIEAGVNHHVEAILRYVGADDHEPTTMRRACTETHPCGVVNCPFLYYPIVSTICSTFDQMKSLANDPVPPVVQGKFKESFLNFAMPGFKIRPGQVNGHHFTMPSVSALTQWDEVGGSCAEADCGEDKICSCTYTLDLNYGDTAQMIFLNMGQGRSWSHPIHLHGHSFYVLKMGYPPYNPENGKIAGDNGDIDCGNTTLNFCNEAIWANRNWGGDNIPGLELKNAPRKDTIIVPSGGYVVIRFRADNPGLWFLHCHIELHSAAGMAMLINEAPSKIPSAPSSFPTCSSFSPIMQYATSASPTMEHATEKDPTKENKPIGTYSPELFWGVVGCLSGLCLFEFFILIRA